jgi:gliding motility-associated-like protein
MKKLFIYLVILFLSHSLIGQNESNIWYFGNNAGIDFNVSPPTPLVNGAIMTTEGCASICNSTGQLLFYTDGITVWNKNHVSMSNGTGLQGNSSTTQSAAIIPLPGSTTIYYIFTVALSSSNAGLRYSIVDMTLAGGLGDVTTSKNILVKNNITEKVTAVKHINNIDKWIIIHELGNNNFLSYRLTPSGLNAIPVTSSAGSIPFIGGDEIGYMKPSPDCSKIALAARYLYLWELYDFNNATGIVSNPLTIPSANKTYGVEFSPDNKLLYLSGDGGTKQLNLMAGNTAAILASSTNVGPCSWAIQLAPDGKIYGANFNGAYLDVINNPNGLQGACGYSTNSFYLNGKISMLGLPNYTSNVFFDNHNSFTSTIVCNGDSTNFILNHFTTYDSVEWNFDDPITGLNNISTLSDPGHLYSSPGTYTVTLLIRTGTQTETLINTVVVLTNCDIVLLVPNVFTPNGDGQNDLFIPIEEEGIIKMQATIFNRWGQRIFTSNNLMIEWNGKNTNGNESAEGTYFYIIKYTDLNGNPLEKKGYLNLIR